MFSISIVLIAIIQILFGPPQISADIDNEVSEEDITIDWNTSYQTIKGFGTFGGPDIYTNSQKEKFIDLLFGDNGLQLNVIRSTLPPNMNFTDHEKNPEIWVLKRARDKYGVKMFMASAWSPPYQWKSSKGHSTGEHNNHLLEEHYDDFAKYMADYAEFRKRIGLDLYAISPQNEPEFATTNWDGCVWMPQQTAKFVRYHLKPVFANRTLSTKIIIGENANWNVANMYLSVASMMLREDNFDIYASHGYSFPNFPKFRVTYNKHVFPWMSSVLYKKERWITEASATDTFDPSMKKGIEMAVSLSRFLTTGNINGYVFWEGVVGGMSNEGLVVANETGYILPRVYRVYGHFSRFIKPGYIRIKASKSFFPLESDMEIVASKSPTSNAFTIVLTNYSSSKTRNSVLKFKGQKIDPKSIKAIITDESKEWAPISHNLANNGSISLTVPPMSIITITGKAVTHR